VKQVFVRGPHSRVFQGQPVTSVIHLTQHWSCEAGRFGGDLGDFQHLSLLRLGGPTSMWLT